MTPARRIKKTPTLAQLAINTAVLDPVSESEERSSALELLGCGEVVDGNGGQESGGGAETEGGDIKGGGYGGDGEVGGGRGGAITVGVETNLMFSADM